MKFRWTDSKMQRLHWMERMELEWSNLSFMADGGWICSINGFEGDIDHINDCTVCILCLHHWMNGLDGMVKIWLLISQNGQISLLICLHWHLISDFPSTGSLPDGNGGMQSLCILWLITLQINHCLMLQPRSLYSTAHTIILNRTTIF